jgi:hypothetical protein
MATSHVRYSPGFFKEQDFPGSIQITADQVGKKRFFAQIIAPAWL